MGAPKIGRSGGVGPGPQLLAARLGMRADQGPHCQEMGVVENDGAVDTGQFDELPLPLDGTGPLADGDVFDRTSDQSLAGGAVRGRMAVVFPGGGDDILGIQDAYGVQDVFQTPMGGIIDQQRPLPFEAEIKHHLDEIRRDLAISQAIRQAALEVSDVVNLPLFLAFRGQNPGLVHNHQLAVRREMGHDIRVVHDAVDRMEELGIELAGRGVVDMRPFHGTVVHEAEVSVHGQVGERVGRRRQPIEELLQMALGNVADARTGPHDQRQCHGQVFAGAAGNALQVLDEFHPIRFARLDPQPLGGKTLYERIRGAGILQEAIHRKFRGLGMDYCQQLAELRRKLAVVEETGRVLGNRDRILLRAAFRLIPMGNEADDFSPDLGLGYGSKYVQRRHVADNTIESPRTQ